MSVIICGQHGFETKHLGSSTEVPPAVNTTIEAFYVDNGLVRADPSLRGTAMDFTSGRCPAQEMESQQQDSGTKHSTTPS